MLYPCNQRLALGKKSHLIESFPDEAFHHDAERNAFLRRHLVRRWYNIVLTYAA